MSAWPLLLGGCGSPGRSGGMRGTLKSQLQERQHWGAGGGAGRGGLEWERMAIETSEQIQSRDIKKKKSN